ncbi:transporter [Myxococcota bacterium]|nr:transporter [Myxococcota bacterium]
MIALLSSNPVLLLFVVAALGFLVGRVRVGAFSLGVAAVLFVGLAVGSIDPSLALPEFVPLFGLSLFVYTIGLTSGPGFFRSLRRRGLKANLLALGVLTSAATLAWAGGKIFGLSGARVAGIFAGATTNTPALAGVLDALKRGSASAAELAEPVVGYSVAYPIGVLAILAAIYLAERLLGIDFSKEEVSRDDAETLGQHVAAATVRIERPIPEEPASELAKALDLEGVVFSRFRRGGAVDTVTDDVILRPGDTVNVVGEESAVEQAVEKLGRRLDERLDLDRTRIDYRRIFVSRPDVAERPIRELELASRFGAVVTRVRRGDAEFVPTRDTELELGDRVRVVAPRLRMDEVSKFFGDSYRALAEVDVITFGLGIALGLALGLVELPLPGGGSFKLGYAGGPLIAGLVLGRLGRTGPLLWTLPYSANLTLRQSGILLFLAGVGLRSGWAFATTLKSGSALGLIALGAVVTTTLALVTLFVGHKLLKIPGTVLVGMLAGIQTQPADLTFAIERTKGEVPNVGYAAVYPIATIAKIVLAQLIVLAS